MEQRMIGKDQLLLEQNKQTCTWFGSYGIVTHLAQIAHAQNIVEIGVAYGYHADFICTNLPSIKYTGVDPYLAGYDAEDIFCNDVQKLFQEAQPQIAMDRLYSAVSSNLKKFEGRASLIREKSWLAAQHFQDRSLDIVYIDGDHTYEAVVKDLAAWHPKIKKGGILCGDDIGWSGVKRAVDEFFLGLGKEYQIISKNGFENMPAFYCEVD